MLSSVGEDPGAWFQKTLDERLEDPKFQAELLARAQGKVAKGSRSTEVRLPPTLSRTSASAGNGEGGLGDLSNASLWAAATSK